LQVLIASSQRDGTKDSDVNMEVAMGRLFVKSPKEMMEDDLFKYFEVSRFITFLKVG